MQNPTGKSNDWGKASKMTDTVPLSKNRVHFRITDMNRKSCNNYYSENNKLNTILCRLMNALTLYN